MMHFYYKDVRFEVKNFNRMMDWSSSIFSPSTRLDVETDIKNFDFVENLFREQFQPAFIYMFNIELEPKGLLHQCRFMEYSINDDKIFFQLNCILFDPNYINLKKQRRIKLKQLDNENTKISLHKNT